MDNFLCSLANLIWKNNMSWRFYVCVGGYWMTHCQQIPALRWKTLGLGSSPTDVEPYTVTLLLKAKQATQHFLKQDVEKCCCLYLGFSDWLHVCWSHHPFPLNVWLVLSTCRHWFTYLYSLDLIKVSILKKIRQSNPDPLLV